MLTFPMHSFSPAFLTRSLAGYFTKACMDRSNLFSSFLATVALFLRFVLAGEYIWETWTDDLLFINLLLIFSVKSQSVNFAMIAGISENSDFFDLWAFSIFFNNITKLELWQYFNYFFSKILFTSYLRFFVMLLLKGNVLKN